VNTDAVDIEALLAYCASLAGEFKTRLSRIRHFVPNNYFSGGANEAILRDFLGGISAGVFEVGTGFVCNPLRGFVSRQCDILVFDRRCPLVSAEGGVTVVWPDAALMVIEVKTAMATTKQLREAILNVASVKATGAQHTIGVVFAFGSLTPETVLEVLNDPECDPQHRPVAVLLFEQGVIVQQMERESAERYGGSESPYEVRRCRGEDRSGHVLAYLLLLFLRTQFSYGAGPPLGAREDLLMATHLFLDTVAPPGGAASLDDATDLA
jgi:hypothetical protein